jgi:hypothetical protein
MSNKFLLSADGKTNLSNGSATLFGATIGAVNFSASMPVKTNSNKQLVSTKLDISDVNNLQSQLDDGVSNPYVGTMEATDFKTSTHSSFNTDITNLETKTQNQTAISGTTTFSGNITGASIIHNATKLDITSPFIDLNGQITASNGISLKL